MYFLHSEGIPLDRNRCHDNKPQRTDKWLVENARKRKAKHQHPPYYLESWSQDDYLKGGQ